MVILVANGAQVVALNSLRSRGRSFLRLGTSIVVVTLTAYGSSVLKVNNSVIAL